MIKIAHNIIISLIFFFSLSTFNASKNIYANSHDANICSSSDNESNNDINCISHCALTQFDDLDSIDLKPFERIVFFNIQNYKEKQNYHTYPIDLRSNYPPFIV